MVVARGPFGRALAKSRAAANLFVALVAGDHCLAWGFALRCRSPAMNRPLLVSVFCLLPLLSCCAKEGAPRVTELAVTSAVASASVTPAPAPALASGVVQGIVRISGDASPDLPSAKEIPVGKCFKAHERHKLVFRKAADGGVADALVGVTEYKASVPKATAPVVVTMEDCSLGQRTVAVMFGQEIHMKNKGPTAAMPQLVGLPTPAVIAAVPGGDPVTLIPTSPGRYEIVDRSHPFASADVYVVNYPTVAVTNEQGRFQIPGVPAGEVKVSVMLPSTGLTAEKRVNVEAGKSVEVSFDLTFELAKYESALELGRRQAEAASSQSPSTSTP